MPWWGVVSSAVAPVLLVGGWTVATWGCGAADARPRRYAIRRGTQGRRRRPKAGWAALTETERKVAALVADGRSNPDIAARLFISRRTVQFHVSNILAKLGLTSRVGSAYWYNI